MSTGGWLLGDGRIGDWYSEDKIVHLLSGDAQFPTHDAALTRGTVFVGAPRTLPPKGRWRRRECHDFLSRVLCWARGDASLRWKRGEGGDPTHTEEPARQGHT